jgi:hypothetical protein
VTLHEAIVEVLRAHSGGWMYRDDIAREIARRDLFRRPSDGTHPPSDQIRLRARKPAYQHLFECSDAACTRIRLRTAAKPSGAAKPAKRGGRASASRQTVPKSTPRRPAAKDQSDTAWYDQLRDEYRPTRLALVLIGESPPDPGAGARRFFYAPELTHDNRDAHTPAR